MQDFTASSTNAPLPMSGLTEEQVKTTVQAAADAVWEELLTRFKGRQFAHYEEHPDGSATVTTFTNMVFTRQADGRIVLRRPVNPWDFTNPNQPTVEVAYPLFVSNSKFWETVVPGTLFDEIQAKLSEQVQALTPGVSETDADRLISATYAAAHRLYWSIIDMPPKMLKGHLIKQLYRLYDPKVFKLVRQHAGMYARDSNTYNTALALQHLNLPPALMAIAMSGEINEHLPPGPLDEALVTRTIKQWLNDYAAPISMYGVNQHGLIRRGLWRFLLKQKSSTIQEILKRTNPGDFLDFLALVHEAGHTPRMTALSYLFNYFVRVRQLADEFNPTLFAQFIRAVHRATVKSRGIRAQMRLFNNQHHNVLDWLASNPTLTNHQANLPLEWWVQQSEAWHADWVNALERRPTRNHVKLNPLEAYLQPVRERHYQERVNLTESISSWRSGITSITLDDVSVTALTTPEELRVEAKELQHCVAGYSDICRRNQSRIFSLSSKAGRSTVELSYSAARGTWVVQQHYGPRNTPAPKPHTRILPEFTKLFNEKHGPADPNPFTQLERRHLQEINQAAREFKNKQEHTGTPIDLRTTEPQVNNVPQVPDEFIPPEADFPL